MKRIIALLALIISANVLYGQADSNLTSKFLLNFSIPDAPAFSALGTNPSNILRPSDIQKFSAMLAPFYSNGKAVIPKNFALEVAPWKLASKNWTLSKYDSGMHSFLYNSAFSLGTIKDTGAFGTKIAIGYRVSLQSRKNDILKVIKDNNAHSLKDIDNINSSITAFQNNYTSFISEKRIWLYNIAKQSRGADPKTLDAYFKSHQANFVHYLDSIAKVSNDAVLKSFVQRYDSLFNLKQDFLTAYSNRIDSTLKKFKNDRWNANRLDLAVALVSESSDSLLTHVQYGSFNFWATWAIGIGTSGQLLLGTNLIVPRTEQAIDRDTTRVSFTQNIRMYEGTSEFRGFIESQFKYQNYKGAINSLLFNIGAEFRMGSFWVMASTGINNYLTSKNLNQFVTNLDLRYSFNK